MPAGGGPGPHVHPIDEWFNVLEGTITFRLDHDEVQGGPGDSIWIPRGTVHQFHTETAAHVLNGCTPGGFKQIVIGLGTPAPRRELPPEQDPPTPVSFERLMNNFWSASADSGWARKWSVQ